MSATTVKNSKNIKQAQPALATTGRGAALYITLGIFFLTLGAAWTLCLVSTEGSYALEELRKMLFGLCGPLCPALPALLIWGGAKLMVSSRHRVSVRNFLIVCAIFVLMLAGNTLTAQTSSGPYLDVVRSTASSAQSAFSSEFSLCLNQAYIQGSSGAGGLIGMAIAYPLSHVLTRVGAAVFVGALLAALLLMLFRINPGAFFRKASDAGERHRVKALEKRRERQENQPRGYQSEERPQMAQNPQEAPAPDYYSAAPVYNAQPARQDDQGFYPVVPDLYEERFPQTEQARSPMPQPDWRKPETEPARQTTQPAAPAKQETNPRGGRFSSLINRLITPDSAEEAPQPAPVQSQPQPLQPKLQPAPKPTSQALDDDEDDLPWDEPAAPTVKNETGRAFPASAPVPVPTPRAAQPAAKPDPRKEEKTDYKPRHAAKSAPAAAPASAVPAPAANTSSWADQVSKKQREAEQPKAAARLGSEPKPVYTDPVMPITGERISITPAKEMKELEAGQRLDGTSAPKVKQTQMSMEIPYQAPPIRLLKEAKPVAQADAAQEDERRAQIIEGTLRSFAVESEVKQIMHGPSITRFAIQIAPGVKVSRVANTSDNLALELKTQHVRVEAPIQGTNYIGIEVPNQLVSTVTLREVLDSPEMRANPSPLLVALGKDIAGAPVLCDLSKMPHLLIAGATGSGKSVCINSIVCSLLYRTSPEQVRLIMIDPKQVELSVYNSIPHLLVPVVSDPKKAAGALAWVVQEMLERYGKFSAQGVRNLAGYNKVYQGTDKALPNIVVIIDEMADLMEVCRKDVEESIRRLAALARAAGIYMVLATQRPSVDVITGVIKNNIPSRIAFAVSSGTDSRTIIDINGAEKLMGKGDMLYKPTGTSARRVQGCFVSDEEVNAIAEYIGSRYQTDYDPNIVDHLENTDKDRGADEITGGSEEESTGGGDGSFQDLLQQAIEMAVEDGQTSTSMLQRRLRVGYARAGRLIDEMEKRNIISQSEGSKPRKTLITREQYAEMMQDK